MPTIKELVEEYTVTVYREDIGCEIPICGLCANTGVLDTTASAIWQGKGVGVKTYCVCYNGRAMKRRKLSVDLYK